MQTKTAQYVNGFDWARAVMSIAVVTWHMHTFGKSLLYSENFSRFKLNWNDALNFHLTVVSVPVFVLISCYFMARNQTDWPRLRHRLWRLALLVVFWTVLMSLWKGGYVELKKMIPESPLDLFVIVVSANGEYYYFFMMLIFSLLVSFGAARLSNFWNWAGLALSTALVFFLPQIVMSNQQTIFIAYWNPINFLPYPFAATLVFRYQDRILANWRSQLLCILGLLAISAAFAAYEWTHYIQGVFYAEGVAIPLLMRASHIYLGSAIIVLALWPCRAAPAFIRYMSNASLALYILHGFYRPVIIQNTPQLGIPDAATRLLQLAVVVLLCYATASVLPLFIKDDMLR